MDNIKGLDKVMGNLNREIQAIKGRSMQGLIKAAILIRADMDKTPPLIPIDTGNLRASWNPGIPIKKGNEIGITIGFSANYAVFVHEMVDADFTSARWRYKKGKKRKWYTPRAGSGAKFFEYSIKRNEKEVLLIIANNAQIK